MNKKTSWTMITVSVLALCFLLFASACNKKEEQPSNSMAEQPAAAPAATPIDPATVATVSGTVKFDGPAPKEAKIDMSQDPACKGMNAAENIVVDNGDLANVFVYVKDGLGTRTFDVPTAPAVLDQSGCKYHPHVLGVMARPPTTFIPRRKTIANGTNRSRHLLRQSKRISPAKKSCCR